MWPKTCCYKLIKRKVKLSIVVSVKPVPDMVRYDIAHLSGNKQGMSKRRFVISVDTKANTKNSFQYTMLMVI